MATQNKIGRRQPNKHILDIITPIGIEWHQSDFWFGDQLARVILITKYPPRVVIGWLSKIANMEGVTCSVHLTPTDSTNLVENLSKGIGELAGKIDQGGSALMMQRAEQQWRDAKKLLQKIDIEQENVFYVNISIMITARDKDALERKSRKVQSALAGSKLRGRIAMFNQEAGLLATSPYGELPDKIFDMAKRNMPISTIAGAFPFNSSGINDGQGYIFGKDADGGILLIDTWKRGGDRTNSNWSILGLPGVGKSTAVKHIFLNEYALGTKIIIIDPEREYKDLCKTVGGQWINCGGGSGGRINPLQIKEVPVDDEDDDEKLYKDEGKGMGALALHFQTLRTFFKLYLKNMDDVEQALLEELLEEVYADSGITWTTDPRTIPNDQYPLPKHVYEKALQKSQDEKLIESRRSRYDKLALLLRRMAVGADSALWNGPTTIEANADFIVLDTYDLQEADETIKRTQYFNILTWAWQIIAADRQEKILLGVDEAYLAVDPNVPQALQFMRNVSKRIRKYMGGLAVISHSVVDFLDESVKRYGQALLDNPCFKFFMGTDGKNLKELAELMDLTEAEQEMLAKKERGHGLLIAGSKRIHGVVELADFELKMFGKGGGA